MLIIGLYLVFASTIVAFHVENAPRWLDFISNIVFFTGWTLCTISWYLLTEKLKRIEETNKYSKKGGDEE